MTARIPTNAASTVVSSFTTYISFDTAIAETAAPTVKIPVFDNIELPGRESMIDDAFLAGSTRFELYRTASLVVS